MFCFLNKFLLFYIFFKIYYDASFCVESCKLMEFRFALKSVRVEIVCSVPSARAEIHQDLRPDGNSK